MQILIIDDDLDLLNACGIGLTSLGHEVRTAETGDEGLRSVESSTPDIVVLDLGLPDLDGLEVCRQIRATSDLPVVVLSADGSEDRKVDALDLGADDYVTKPFGMRELDARLRVAIRHRRHDEPPVELVVEPLHLDLSTRSCTFDGDPIELTPKEFDLLAFLAGNVGRVCTRKMVLESVWGPGYGTELHYLKVYAYRIRRKLGERGSEFIQSDPSIGYRLVPLTS